MACAQLRLRSVNKCIPARHTKKCCSIEKNTARDKIWMRPLRSASWEGSQTSALPAETNETCAPVFEDMIDYCFSLSLRDFEKSFTGEAQVASFDWIRFLFISLKPDKPERIDEEKTPRLETKRAENSS
ncbi:hypothetical protein F2P81_002283 [Scophthalmus maximus]|uniref:Uncharacterized protein n=1 Tax=Scophthalmus maximus TaxID=52904 RepID=A0A6A4TRA0_SCOMX|nr:hypothetical protein F2P81_002283 [Scophthalmus maximus]